MKLSITNTEERQDKNERAYKHISVSTPAKVNGISLPVKESAFNAYEDNYLGNKDFGWDLKVGDKILGEFVTREVEAYTIKGEGNKEDREVNTATVLAMPLPGQMGIGEVAIKRAFANAGHILLAASEEVVAEAPAEELTA